VYLEKVVDIQIVEYVLAIIQEKIALLEKEQS
jgi:hypothetical protein